MTPRLRNLGSRVRTLDTRAAKPLPKEADEHYGTRAHRDWAFQIKERAGWRCEIVINGQRCRRSRANGDTMYADHIRDVRDYPELALDLNNGRCACNSHNTSAGIRARAERMKR